MKKNNREEKGGYKTAETFSQVDQRSDKQSQNERTGRRIKVDWENLTKSNLIVKKALGEEAKRSKKALIILFLASE